VGVWVGVDVCERDRERERLIFLYYKSIKKIQTQAFQAEEQQNCSLVNLFAYLYKISQTKDEVIIKSF